MHLILKAIFHGLPVFPLLYNRWQLSLILLLLVALPYIKTEKLTCLYEEQSRREGSSEKELARLKKLINFWRCLTFEQIRNWR